jgi:hypothetical protein
VISVEYTPVKLENVHVQCVEFHAQDAFLKTSHKSKLT